MAAPSLSSDFSIAGTCLFETKLKSAPSRICRRVPRRAVDTQLAPLLWASGVRQLLTTNPDDFRTFGFQILTA